MDDCHLFQHLTRPALKSMGSATHSEPKVTARVLLRPLRNVRTVVQSFSPLVQLLVAQLSR